MFAHLVSKNRYFSCAPTAKLELFLFSSFSLALVLLYNKLFFYTTMGVDAIADVDIDGDGKFKYILIDVRLIFCC